jgi:hypothetical protein
MFDPETFLTELYVLADEFCATRPASAGGHGPAASLWPSEGVPLAIFGQWAQFPSECAFDRWASHHLRAAVPTLPSRPPLNRLIRHASATITAFARSLGQALAATEEPAFEIIDGTGVRTRNAKRRGIGWLPGRADIGWCTRLGWYAGVRLLLDTTPRGAITGFGAGPASTNDRVLAETFFAVRATPDPQLPSVGAPVSDHYIAAMGFSGDARQARGRRDSAACVVCPPQSVSHRAWPKPLRQWLAGLREVIETVTDRLLATFRLDHERPHDVSGLLARLAAKVGLHNRCIWLNRQGGRPDLAVADLIDW